MTRTALTILFFLFALSSFAQEENDSEGQITGRIIDSLSGKAVDYATIGLYTQIENKVVNGATSDSTGAFKITNVSDGTYKIVFEFIGYKKRERNNIVVSKKNSNVDLGEIKLSVNQTLLKEVTISSEKNIIENKIDKLIYNVDRDVTSQSGVAADVLKKVPQVFVDVDGNVELQGNSNIRFLINGRPSVLFGNNITDVLQAIPASQIQSIEIITSPGAKYDAEGTGGIINIILKKSIAQGINGNVSLSAGTRLENGSLNLNARKGKWGVNAFFSGNGQLTSKTINSMNRFSYDSESTSQLLQDGTSDFSRHGYQTGIGFDWDITGHDIFNASVGYDYFGNNNTGSASRQSILADTSGTPSTLDDIILTTNKFYEHSLDYEISYKRKFKKEDQELEIVYDASYGNDYSHYEETQKQISPEEISGSSRGNNPGIENESDIELNYTNPVTKDVLLETGGKTELTRIQSVSDVYLLDISSVNYDYSTDGSSSLDFRRTVYAGYLSASFKLSHALEVKAGARDEYTVATADFSDAGNIHFNPYNTIVPSIVVAHTFKKNQTLKLSYSRRIERPDYGDMNPFINAADPQNITTGNPALRPEIGDKIEFGYTKIFDKKGSINVTLFSRNNTDDIQSYTRFYPVYNIGDSTYTNVSIRTRENIGHENNYGLSIFTSFAPSEKINLRANINGFQRYIYSGISSVADVHGFNYRTNLNVAYQLNSSLLIELFGNFNSPRINAQGKNPSFTTYSFAFRKQLFHKNGSIAITATNFLGEYVNQKTELTGDNFTVSNTRQLPYRSFGINFTYKFGKLEFKKEKEPEDINLTNPPGNEK